MKSELCPVLEHDECRRCDVLYVAQKQFPEASTEKLIEEAAKLYKYVVQEKSTKVVKLVKNDK